MSLNGISSVVWETRKFDDILIRIRKVAYKQNTIKKFTKDYIILFPRKATSG